jgi:thioredoxin reductase
VSGPPRDPPAPFSASDAGATRRRTVPRAEATSDVTRFRGLALATALGAVVAVGAALATAPPGGLTSPGPLARPHARAEVACDACHAAGDERAAVPPPRACAGCHGAHASARPGHARLAREGALGCPTCHAVHGGEQGITFRPDAPPLRWAAGTEAEAAPTPFRPAREATVVLVDRARCAGCHDLADPVDPVARCLVGASGPVTCFDEHQPSLRADLAAATRAPDSVCAAQHTPDRPFAWEAAREVVALGLAPPASGAGGAPWSWLGAGLVASALTLALIRVRDSLEKRKIAREAAARPIEPPARVRLPTIDAARCLGCSACVDACPYDVLAVERYVAVVARPEACCGLTLCEQRCPNGSLRVTDGEPIGDRPRLTVDLESEDQPGLFLAGDVTGLPLIKHAIAQGARAVDAVAASLAGERAPAGELDLLVVGAGPAGISAALRAKELGLSCAIVEQGSAAQSIRSFPRGKLVFDQPLDLPVAGKLWLRESTKEELLLQWMRVVRAERLAIVEDTRLVSVAREGRGFCATTEPREGGPPTLRRARRVLLAIGKRGTPRRLPIELAPEVEGRVHYHLADAQSFAGRRVVVVGLGDVAMEAAVALARQEGTRVTVVHRGSGFSRGMARNVDELRRLADAGRIDLRLGTTVAAIAENEVTLVAAAGASRAPYDAVFVLIGSIPPWDLLAAAGVRPAAHGSGERGRSGDQPPMPSAPR